MTFPCSYSSSLFGLSAFPLVRSLAGQAIDGILPSGFLLFSVRSLNSLVRFKTSRDMNRLDEGLSNRLVWNTLQTVCLQLPLRKNIGRFRLNKGSSLGDSIVLRPMPSREPQFVCSLYRIHPKLIILPTMAVVAH